MANNWVINPDGSVTVTLSVTFDGSYDAYGTGTATLVITPDGGASTLAALLDGDPGLPPVLTVGTVTTLAPTASATFQLVQTSPGGAGTASAYTVNIGLPQGAAGTTGGVGTIMNASDLTNSATAGYVLSTNGTKGTWIPNYPVIPYYSVAYTSFSAISGTSATSTGVAASLTIPAQIYRYRPIVSGLVPVTSASDTWIDVQVMMGASTSTAATIAASGTQIGYGVGQASATAFAVPFRENFGVAMTPSDTSPAAAIAAGTAQTIVVSAVRQYGTSAWSTAQKLNNAMAELHVTLMPV